MTEDSSRSESPQSPPNTNPNTSPNTTDSSDFEARENINKPRGALPLEAEISYAKNRRFAETIVFIHHFGGSKRTVLRHLRFVNDLGFDAVRFNLRFAQRIPPAKLPITADLRFGVRHFWASDVETIFNALPGPKIAYSFSMPSWGALTAISRRNAEDVSAWICDGGPFLQITKCTANLLEHEYRVKNRALRTALTAVSAVVFGVESKQEIASLFATFPKAFPVLSVRGMNDPLVPPSAIEDVFQLQTHLNYKSLVMKEGRHLDGLKGFPDEYIPSVSRFLIENSTPTT